VLLLTKVPVLLVENIHPCPPSGKHTYEWTITAIGDKKKKLGKAKAKKKYPE